jgi:hypothetical protein
MKLGAFAGGLAGGIGMGMKLRSHMDAQAQRDDIKAINATQPTEFSGPDQFSTDQQAQMQGLQDSGQGYYDEEAGWVGNDGAPIQGLQAPTQAAKKSYAMGDHVQDKAFTDNQVRDWKNNAIARRVMQDDPTAGMSMLRSQQGLQAGDLAIADAERTAGKNREIDALTAEYQEAMRNPEAAVAFMRAGAGFVTSAKDKDGKHRFDESLGIDDEGNWTVIGKDGKVQKYDFPTGFNKIGQLVGMNPVQYIYEQRLGAVSPDHYKNVVGFADKREDNARMDRQLDEMTKYRQGMLDVNRVRAARGAGGAGGGLGKLAPKDRFMLSRDDATIKSINTQLNKLDLEDPAQAQRAEALQRQLLITQGQQYDRLSGLGMIPEGVSRADFIDPAGSVQTFQEGARKVIQYAKTPEHFQQALQMFREDAEVTRAVYGDEGYEEVLAGLQDYYSRKWSQPRQADIDRNAARKSDGLQRREGARDARLAPQTPWLSR